MLFATDKLIEDAMVALDMNRYSESLLTSGDIDTLMLNDIIHSNILEGVRRVNDIAPLHLLESGHNITSGLMWPDQTSAPYWGWFVVPTDFQRIVMLQMSDWDRGVGNLIATDDALYKRQKSRVKALRGSPERPVAALVKNSLGRIIEFYSCQSTSAVMTQGVYIPLPSEYDGTVDISELCYKACVYMIAGLTLASCKEGDAATSMIELSKTYLNI